jgi:hypothetical protein
MSKLETDTGSSAALPAGLPPSSALAQERQNIQAVIDALIQLGEDADPRRVARAVKAQAGLDMDPAEVAAIREALRERAQIPPGLDQPPPEDCRRDWSATARGVPGPADTR